VRGRHHDLALVGVAHVKRVGRISAFLQRGDAGRTIVGAAEQGEEGPERDELGHLRLQNCSVMEGRSASNQARREL
jgi:hypothetical protein